MRDRPDPGKAASLAGQVVLAVTRRGEVWG